MLFITLWVNVEVIFKTSLLTRLQLRFLSMHVCPLWQIFMPETSSEDLAGQRDTWIFDQCCQIAARSGGAG